MTIDYTGSGEVRIIVFSYIGEILTAFEKADPKGRGTKSSAAPNNFPVVSKDCKKLDKEKVVELHNIVANTLYATKRARPDT